MNNQRENIIVQGHPPRKRKMLMKNREQFSGNLSVIMAMAGSAIGLGNIWRFPYIVGEYGGAAFIIVYFAACLFIALPIFYAETIIGRRGGLDTYGSMKRLAPGTHWYKLGLLTIISPMLILSYYSVVGVWSIHYLFKSVSGTVGQETGQFSEFISSVEAPILAHTVFVILVAAIILGGVKKGIEKFSKITMPILFFLILVIVVYSLTLPGAGGGVDYLVRPDFSKLTGGAIASAVGQAFFSLSLGVGTVLTYASYMRKQDNILVSGLGTAGFDFLFALLAGFAVMPAVFAAGLSPSSGPGLVFETLPYIFGKMGAGSVWLTACVAGVFFLAVLMAALSSAISILEVGVAYLVEEKGLGRSRATLYLSLFAWAVGLLCSLSFGPLADFKILGSSIFEFLDKLCSNWMMPLGGLLFTLFVGWKMPSADVLDEFSNGGSKPWNVKIYPFVRVLLRYVAPIGIIFIFLNSVL